MKVIVAGATGAIGVPLVQQLVANGHKVIGLTRSNEAALRHSDSWSGALVADIFDPAGLDLAARKVRADAVIHQMTAIDGAPTRYRHLDATNRLRTEGTKNLMRLARTVGASRMITQSFLGGYGYGDHLGSLSASQQPISETQSFGPPGQNRALDRIIAAMRAAEKLSLSEPTIEGLALRYGVFYGHGESLRAFLEQLRKRRVPVPSDGGGTLSFIYLPDAAAATVAALEQGSAGESYNVCDDRPVQWSTFIDAATDAFDLPPARRIPSWVLKAAPYAHAFLTSNIPMSNAKAKKHLGWEPVATDVQTGWQLASRLAQS